jgi:hypothetical protein
VWSAWQIPMAIISVSRPEQVYHVERILKHQHCLLHTLHITVPCMGLLNVRKLNSVLK